MNLNAISKVIFEKKNTDYLYVIFFLLIFSIFIVFAIKPSLTTAYSLKKEEIDLIKIDMVYEEKINNITSIQSQIEDNRDNLPLLNQSIPERPEVNKIIEDVKKTADKNSIIIDKTSIVDIDFSKTNKEKRDVKMKMEVTTSFENLKQFITDILGQRRLKLIDELIVSKDKDSSGSGNLKVNFIINGYYL